jgi:hypothetical protein
MSLVKLFNQEIFAYNVVRNFLTNDPRSVVTLLQCNRYIQKLPLLQKIKSIQRINKDFGGHNVAFGKDALISTTSGRSNVAFGNISLYSNTTGDNNVACGYAALYNLTGSNNVGMGDQSSHSNKTGSNNVAVGVHTLFKNIIGNSLVAIGHEADVSVDGLTNSCAIGAESVVTTSNTIQLGNFKIISLCCEVNLTTPSDKHQQICVTENVPGIEFINRLRPVTYRSLKGDQRICKTGFIGQEVHIAAQQVDYNFNGISIPEEKTNNYGLSYSLFVVPLVKAVQEQQKIIQLLQKQIQELTTRLEKIELQRWI